MKITKKVVPDGNIIAYTTFLKFYLHLFHLYVVPSVEFEEFQLIDNGEKWS